MLRKGLLFSASLLCSVLVFGQTTNAFRVNYDVALFDLPIKSTESLTPENYVFSGFHTNFLPIVSSLTEINSDGTVAWAKRYSGGISYMFGDFKKDPALNRYYVCGGSGNGPAFLMFVDATGNFISGQNFSIAQATGAFFNRVTKTSDGGYVCVGYVTGHNPGGGETNFVSVSNNPGDCSGPATETISSPLIVKFDASGNHLWHHVFRYYAGSVAPGNRIYNDGSFVDIVEASDGYIAMGDYDVNNVFSDYDDDCEDVTPTDAMVLKTTTAGTITYHRQIDNPSNSIGQTSKSFTSASLTAAGQPLLSGTDGSGRPCFLMRLPNSGGWSVEWERKYGAGNIFGTYFPFLPSRFFETSDGNYALWLNYIPIGLPPSFENVLLKINPTTNAQIWAKRHLFNFASILPHGEQVSDGGYIGVSYTLAGTGHDMHVIKTDPNGDGPASCAATNLTTNNGTTGYTYGTPLYNSWNTGTVTNTAITPTVTNITPGTSVQCLHVICTAPTINTQPTDQTICSTGSGNLTVDATAGSYQWQYNNGGSWENVTNGSPAGFTYSGATTDNLTITSTGAPQGTYQFQVIAGDPTCETISNTITVTVPGATQLAPASPTCSGVALNFEAFPTTGATYAWNVTTPPGTSATPTNGGGQTFSYTPTNNTATVQNFTVDVDITVNSITCPVQFTNTVNPQPTAPIVGTITQPDCSTPTGSVTLSGLPSSGTWTVTASPGGATLTSTGTTGIITGLTANTSYTFTVENSFGCTSVASTGATVDPQPPTPSAPIIGTITQPDCINPTGSVALSGLPSAGTWTVTVSPGGGTINGTGTTSNFTGLTPNATYTFTVTDNTGCTSVVSANALINPVPGAPTAPIVGTVTQPTCATATGSVELSGLPASGTWTLTETPGGGTTNGTGTTTTITGLTGNTTYTYTVTDDLGCTSSASVDVTINSQPTTPSTPIVGTVTQPDCATATGSVDFSGLPATGSWTLTASPGGATETNTGTTGTISGLAPNTSYTFTVENSDGCTSSATVSVDIDPQPTTPSAPILGTVTQPDCTTPTGSVDLSGLPATGTWTVTVSPGGGTVNGTGSTTTFTGLGQGNTYTFTVTNDEGCTSVSSTILDIDPVAGAPIVTLDDQTNVTCNGDTDGELVISVAGGQAPYNYSWTPNVGTTPTVSGLSAGSYTVVVTDDLGCTGTDTYTITGPDVLSINELVTNVNCEASLGSIMTNVTGGSGPYDYVWTPNGEITNGLTDLAAGNYGLEVTDANGCTVSDNFTIVTVGSLSIDVDPEYSLIEEGESVQLTATGGENYSWTPSTGLSCDDCANPIASPTETTTYYVTAVDSSGCTGGDTALIEIRINCGELYVPNIFSPNGDMNNDYLCLYGSCVTKVVYTVYDRWGELVFETESTVNLETGNHQEVCWDGTYRGKPLNSGVFAYKLYAELFDGEIIEESGNITLVR